MGKNEGKPSALILIILFTVVISITNIIGGSGPVSAGSGNPTVFLLGILFLFLGTTGIYASYGLWKLKMWANRVTRIIYLISIPIGVFAFLLDSRATNIVIQLANIGIDVWIIWYLMTPGTKRLFEGAR
ncbi:MAG: DUF2127 domain-containing protein [Desulfobacteraceae bacterium]|nr:DUF2127 domain-containing protein [Desulfobacteraceae bacterium]